MSVQPTTHTQPASKPTFKDKVTSVVQKLSPKHVMGKRKAQPAGHAAQDKMEAKPAVASTSPAAAAPAPQAPYTAN